MWIYLVLFLISRQEISDLECLTPHPGWGHWLLSVWKEGLPTGEKWDLDASPVIPILDWDSDIWGDISWWESLNLLLTERWKPSNTSVDGGWSDWNSWSPCIVVGAACGPGVQSSRRECSEPEPRNGGANCSGEMFRTRPCNSGSCGPGNISTLRDTFCWYTYCLYSQWHWLRSVLRTVSVPVSWPVPERSVVTRVPGSVDLQPSARWWNTAPCAAVSRDIPETRTLVEAVRRWISKVRSELLYCLN